MNRRGFTIIELLVASMLLGLLVTILTMIFNQSSIAWRTGLAGTLTMDKVRANIAEIREESDNAFVHNQKLYRLTGLWDRDGQLRDRACDAPGSKNVSDHVAVMLGGASRTGSKWISNLSSLKPKDFKSADVGTTSADAADTYSVNVMSGGPNNDINDYQAIWSFPDDFDL